MGGMRRNAGWVELYSEPVARRKRRKAFRAVTAVKGLARERIGTPPPGQVVPDRKKKEQHKEKHKTTLGQLLRSDD